VLWAALGIRTDVRAAHLLGLDEVPCIVLAHLTPTQRRAYALADNKLALNAGWDLEMLSLEIGELGIRMVALILGRTPPVLHSAMARIFQKTDYAALTVCPGNISRPEPSGTALALVAYLFLHHLC
jgi:hypothetical protein